MHGANLGQQGSFDRVKYPPPLRRYMQLTPLQNALVIVVWALMCLGSFIAMSLPLM